MKRHIREKDGEMQILSSGIWCRAIRRVCLYCHKQFYARVVDVRRGQGLYCSTSCTAKATNPSSKAVIRCVICKGIRVVRRSHKNRYKTCGRPYCRERLQRRNNRRMSLERKGVKIGA